MKDQLDFESLSLQDALDIAIVIETNAAERYEELADQLDVHRTAEAAEFFRTMIGEERSHQRKLQQRRRELFGATPSCIDGSAIPELEAPEYDSVRAFMTEHAALRVALHGEERARDFFAQAKEQVMDPAVKKLFNELHAEELVHVATVTELLEALPPAENANPDAFVDEPVAQ